MENVADSPNKMRKSRSMGPGGQQVDFNTFKTGFSQGMNFLKRRFSSSDLVDEVNGEVGGHPPAAQPQPSGTTGPPPAGYGAQSTAQRPDQAGFSLHGLSNKMSSTISAPTSPAKSQQVGSHSMVSQAATGQKQPAYSKERCKCLLVIDNANTDWSKYFRNKKILGEFEIRVEQAEFSEMSLASYSDSGCLVDLHVVRSGAKVTRSFQPDFVLIRSPVRTENRDWRRIVIGLLFGGVPSLNSLHSVYNFLDKPWVFAHLLMIQRRLGKEKFPLIDQVYYPSFKEIAGTNKFPVVVKIGHGTKGAGKIKVNGPGELQDVSSVVAVTSDDCTAEPFVDSKYDIHVQKIGGTYKAFMRKGISGHWKANLGSAMLEQIAMTDRYKLWVDEVGQLFGGLDICSVEAIVGKDGREVIYEANDCAMTLLGETQEEDRRIIAELALQKMNHILGVRQALSRKESMGSAAPQNFIKHETPSYFKAQAGQNQPVSGPQHANNAQGARGAPGVQQSPQQHGAATRMRSGSGSAGHPPGGPPGQGQGQPPPQPGPRPPAQGAPIHSQPPSQAPPPQPQRQPMPQGAPPPNPAQPGGAAPQQPAQPPPPGRGPPPPRPTRQPSLPKQPSRDSVGGPPTQPPGNPQPGNPGHQAVPGQQGEGQQRQGQPAQPGQQQGGEDTMTNLRKTFAGIFGDM